MPGRRNWWRKDLRRLNPRRSQPTVLPPPRHTLRRDETLRGVKPNLRSGWCAAGVRGTMFLAILLSAFVARAGELTLKTYTGWFPFGATAIFPMSGIAGPTHFIVNNPSSQRRRLRNLAAASCIFFAGNKDSGRK